MCSRTIYCTNIDKKVVFNLLFLFRCFLTRTGASVPNLVVHSMQVTQADVKLFFESLCGEVGISV